MRLRNRRRTLDLPTLLLVGLLACAGSPVGAPAPITALTSLRGDNQRGTPGYRLGESLAVRLLDTDGVPVIGAVVQWGSDARDAAVVPASSMTDADGIATATWRLGRDPGVQRATASFRSLTAVQFRATAATGEVTHASGVLGYQCGRYTDDIVRCWADPGLGDGRAIALDTDIRFLSLAFAAGTWCGSTRSATVACFDLAAMLPGGVFRPDAAPVRVISTGVPMFVQLAGSPDDEAGVTWCGVANDSRLWCWGSNRFGQAGSGTPGTPVPVPTPVAGDVRAIAVVVTRSATCALDPVGAAYCFGGGGDSVVSTSTPTITATPVPTPLRFAQLAATATGTVCGLAPPALLVHCWGSNSSGGLGRGGVPNASVPAPITGTDFFVSIGATGNGFLGVTVDRDLVVWGSLAPFAASASPVHVLTGQVFVDVLPIGGDGVLCLRIFPDGTMCLDRRGVTEARTGVVERSTSHGIPAGG